MSTLRERILSADDIRTETVEVPEWGVSIEVRGLSAKARAEVLQNSMDARGTLNFAKAYSLLVIACAMDPETHQPIFEAADRDTLDTKSGGALERVALAAARLSGLDNEAEARFPNKTKK